MMSFTSIVVAVAALAASVEAAPKRRATGQFIVPFRGPSYCLSVQGTPADGALVTPADCFAGGGARLWDISPGDGLVRLSGTNFCLDAGTNPHNNVEMKVWTCYPGLSNQQWYYTSDNRIAITGGTQCLDFSSTNIVQTYQCTSGNNNQVFVAQPPNSNGKGGVTSSATPPPVATSSSAAPPAASSSTVPVSNGKAIKFKADPSLCLTVVPGKLTNGQAVGLYQCSDQYYASWSYTAQGLVQLGNSGFCLDAGTNPHNNVGLKIWQCYPGLSNQIWKLAGNTISVADASGGFNQCVDKTQNGVVSNGFSPLQTYQCTAYNTNQMYLF